MPRLFIGTFLSQDDQQKLSVLQSDNEHLESLWERKPRWVKPVKLHITWLFLGSVEQNLVAKLSSTLHKVIYERNKMQNDEDRKDLVMEFTKPEVWPNSRKPRLIVVANKPIPRAVESLARTIRTGLIPFYTAQTEQEHNQDFKPHVTLMRLDRRIETPADKLAFHRVEIRVDPTAINSLDEALPIKLKVEDVCLVESNVNGDDYKILDTVRLRD